MLRVNGIFSPCGSRVDTNKDSVGAVMRFDGRATIKGRSGFGTEKSSVFGEEVRTITGELRDTRVAS